MLKSKIEPPNGLELREAPPGEAAQRLGLDTFILGRLRRQGTSAFPPASPVSLSWTDSPGHQRVARRHEATCSQGTRLS